MALSQNQELKKRYDELVLDFISNIMADETYEEGVFDDVDYDDDLHAQRKIESLFDRYDSFSSNFEISEVLNYYDVPQQLMKYHHKNAESYNDELSYASFVQASDGIDDLFARDH